MAENKTLEREYVIPLKREWLKVPRYERTSKAIKTVSSVEQSSTTITSKCVYVWLIMESRQYPIVFARLNAGMTIEINGDLSTTQLSP